MERILVTGYNGQLGYDVVKELEKRNIQCKGVDILDFDITNEVETINYIVNYNPTAVVHCSAYTAVDRAEDEPEKCYAVNKSGSVNIANACKQIGAKMILISTDYVFDGKGEGLVEVDREYGALNVYGKSKVEAEIKVKKILKKLFIVRTSWVFGINGNNFIKTMLRLSETKTELSVVDDQLGTPTYTKDFAILLADMVLSEKYGVYHATNEDFCSFKTFAEKIFELANKQVKVNGIKTKDYVAKAERPLNSKLNKQCLEDNGFKRLPTWQNAVERYLKELSVI